MTEISNARQPFRFFVVDDWSRDYIFSHVFHAYSEAAETEESFYPTVGDVADRLEFLFHEGVQRRTEVMAESEETWEFYMDYHMITSLRPSGPHVTEEDLFEVQNEHFLSLREMFLNDIRSIVHEHLRCTFVDLEWSSRSFMMPMVKEQRMMSFYAENQHVKGVW